MWLVIQTAAIILIRRRRTPIRTVTLGPIVDMAAAWSRGSSTCGSRVIRRSRVLLWPPVDLQLSEYGFLDGGVAGVSRMEWTQPPAIIWRIAPSTTWDVPSCDWVTIEGSLGLLSAWITLGCLWARGALTGDLPRPVEVPEVNFVGSSARVELVGAGCAGLAESVTSEARVDIDIAHFGFIFVRLGGDLVQVVDSADMVVEFLSQVYAKIRCFGIWIEG